MLFDDFWAEPFLNYLNRKRSAARFATDIATDGGVLTLGYDDNEITAVVADDEDSMDVSLVIAENRMHYDCGCGSGYDCEHVCAAVLAVASIAAHKPLRCAPRLLAGITRQTGGIMEVPEPAIISDTFGLLFGERPVATSGRKKWWKRFLETDSEAGRTKILTAELRNRCPNARYHWHVTDLVSRMMAHLDPVAILGEFEKSAAVLAQRTYSKLPPPDPKFIEFLETCDLDAARQRARTIEVERNLFEWLSRCGKKTYSTTLPTTVRVPWFVEVDDEGVPRLSFKVIISSKGVEKERDAQGVEVIARDYRDGKRHMPAISGRLLEWLSRVSDVTRQRQTAESRGKTFSITSVEKWFASWGGQNVLFWDDESPVEFNPNPARLTIDPSQDGAGWIVEFPGGGDAPARREPLSQVQAVTVAYESGTYYLRPAEEAVAYIREGSRLRPLVVNGMPPKVFESLLKTPVFPREKIRNSSFAAVIVDQFEVSAHAGVVEIPVRPVFEITLKNNHINLTLKAEASNGAGFLRLPNGVWKGTDKPKGKATEFHLYDSGEDSQEDVQQEEIDSAAVASAFVVRPRVRDIAEAEEWFETVVPGSTLLPPSGDGTFQWYLSEDALRRMMEAWTLRPVHASYYANPAFLELFSPVNVTYPKIEIEPSGVDFLSVSVEMEEELRRLSHKEVAGILGSGQNRLVMISGKLYRRTDLEAFRQCSEMMDELGLDADGGPQRIHAIQLAGARMNGSSGSMQSIHASIHAMIERIRRSVDSFSGIPRVELPEPSRSFVRPYQQHGVDFLVWAAKTFNGALLADDMGLGKTLQLLAAVACLRQDRTDARPCLVVCPASVAHNWQREAHKFTPGFKVLVMESGKGRKELYQRAGEFDMIVLNFALLRRDINELKQLEWDSVIVDEAQVIKNAQADVTKCVKMLNAKTRFALTGTPIENRLSDLWSIIDFVIPGYLGKLDAFQARVKSEPDSASRRLRARLRPVLLRRLKAEVAPELPDRIEERKDCEMSTKQRHAYLAELKRTREMLDIADGEVIGKQRIQILAALMRLREICCDPALLGLEGHSGKTEELMELLPPLLEAGHKVLVFSQFVRMLERLLEPLQKAGIRTHMLTGKTTKRGQVIANFEQDPEPCVFLLSLKAGGTGLNLTAASYVVLFDPWWNPAVEAQAIDRTHRIGQDKTVVAFRLVTLGTIEERILELQEKKRGLVRDVLEEEAFNRSLSRSDLDFLLSPE